MSYVIPAPGSAVIWLVTNTATLYSRENTNQSQDFSKTVPSHFFFYVEYLIPDIPNTIFTCSIGFSMTVGTLYNHNQCREYYPFIVWTSTHIPCWETKCWRLVKSTLVGPGSDLRRSSAAWRASGPVSAAAPPAPPGRRSPHETEPWWSRWSEGREEVETERTEVCFVYNVRSPEEHQKETWTGKMTAIGGTTLNHKRCVFSFPSLIPTVWRLLLPRGIWLPQSPTAPSGVHLGEEQKWGHLSSQTVTKGF